MTTIHTVTTTKDAVVSEGFTTVSIARTDGQKGKSGLCIVVPVVSESVAALVASSEIGRAWLVDHIDGLRGKIASGIHKAGGTITSDKLGIEALLAAMKLETESQRMTKDAIGAWFDSDLAGLISARLQERMQGIAADKLAKLVDSYKAGFQILAGRDPSMAEAIKVSLQRALELLPEDYDSVIATKVAEKLAVVTEATATLAAL